MLLRSIDNASIPASLPNTMQALASWKGEETPGESVFRAAYQDLLTAGKTKTHGRLAGRLNYDYSGARSLIAKTVRRIDRIDPQAPIKPAFLNIHKDWNDVRFWRVVARNSSAYTGKHYLESLDLEYDEQGGIVARDENHSVNLPLFGRTLLLSAFITLFTAMLGYPVALLLGNQPLRRSNLLMILVLLPFWTSLLVRTSAWIVILQSNGVLNDLLVWMGVIENENRVQMIYNTTGTLVAMTHILLPFMVLPLYAVMKTIPGQYTNAARSLGATAFTAFRKVYFPLTLPGLGAGAALVFILSVGYYITPALVGGQSGRFITNKIAYHMNTSLNWGLAAALSTLLLLVVTVCYLVYNRLVGVDRIRLG